MSIIKRRYMISIETDFTVYKATWVASGDRAALNQATRDIQSMLDREIPALKGAKFRTLKIISVDNV